MCNGLTNLSPYASAEEMLIADNSRMRKAGCELAAAALRVAHEYDGVHRLLLVANEGGRYWMYNAKPPTTNLN